MKRFAHMIFSARERVHRAEQAVNPSPSHRTDAGHDLIEHMLVVTFIVLAGTVMFIKSSRDLSSKSIKADIKIVGQGRITRILAADVKETCDEDCKVEIEKGQTLTLYARAVDGWAFQGWTDACQTAASACRLDNVQTNQKLTATFVKVGGK